MQSSLSIVIVSYNCREPLGRCLQSIPPGPRVLVVDNASTDDTVDHVRRAFPRVTLLANTENRGFAAACNQGLAATTGEFALLLNPDTSLDRSALDRLLAVMAHHPRAGACGPQTRNPDDSLQPSCRRFPTLGAMALAELGWRRQYRMRDFAHDRTRGVDQVMGACLLVRRAALAEVGPFDERFFVYFEETDLCLRLRQAGWDVLFVHDAVITHAGGQSSQTDSVASLRYRYRSLFAFYRKHYPPAHRIVLRVVVAVAALARLLVHSLPPWRDPAKRAGYAAILAELPRL